MPDEMKYHELCRQVLAVLPDIIMIGDGAGRVVYANDAALKMLGLTLPELQNLDPRRLSIRLETMDGRPVTPDEFPLGPALGERRRIDRQEFRLLRDNGETFVLSITAIPFEGSSGFMMCARDISSEKRAEDALRKSEENFRSLSEEMSEGVVVVIDGRAHWANRALTEITGFSHEEIVGNPAFFAMEEKDAAEFSRRLADRMAGRGEERHYEIRIRHREGHWIYLDLYARNTRFDGRDAVQVVVRDVTSAHRQRKELLSIKLAVESASDAVGISDVEGRMTFTNEAFRQMLGYDCSNLQSPGSLLRLYEDRELALEIGKSIGNGQPWSGMARLKSRSGRIIPTLVRADAIRDENGQSIGLIGIGTDMTEAEKSREALSQSEEKYRMLVEASTDAIFLESTDFRILDCNQAAIEMFGYTKDEMLRLSVTDLIPAEDAANLNGLSAEAFSAGGFRIEARNLRKDGSIFPVEVNTRLYSLGGENHVIVFIRDLTEQKKAQAAIVESERFLANIFASIQDGLSILDTDLNIMRVNPVMEKWYEHQLPLPGKKCYQAYHGREQPCEVCPSIRAIATQTSAVDIVPMTGPGGAVAGWLELYSFPLFDQETGKIRGVIEYVHDITARKNAEDALASEKERLAVTLRSIGDGVITTDVEGRVALMNQVAEKLTGYRQEESLGRPLEQVFRIVNEMTREPVPSPVDKVMSTGAVVGLANHTMLVARDGTERAIADSGSPIRDRDSRIVGVVLVFRDVTQKRQVEEQALKADKMESLGILAGGIAHDFNNILTGILGNISLTRMVLPASSHADRLLEAEKACLRARDLTQQLLTFSRGGMPVKTTASIAELISESGRFALRGSRTQLKFEAAPDLWPAEVDVGQIGQVIHNLVLNADQAMPEGGTIRVTAQNFVRAEQGTEVPAIRPGQYVRITVEDEGEGIPPERLKKIFDPFFTTKDTGSGIGLTTSYSIVVKHEGYIMAESTLGRGSKFTLYLPASPGKDPARPPLEEAPLPGSGRVLLMDDEDAIRELGQLMLEELGYEAEVAASGEQAVELYRRAFAQGRPFTAVILDLTVPGGMGGQAALAQLIKIDPAVKAIVSSGYSTDPVMAHYREHGFVGFIAKPYDARALGLTLRAARGA